MDATARSIVDSLEPFSRAVAENLLKEFPAWAPLVTAYHFQYGGDPNLKFLSMQVESPCKDEYASVGVNTEPGDIILFRGISHDHFTPDEDIDLVGDLPVFCEIKLFPRIRRWLDERTVVVFHLRKGFFPWSKPWLSTKTVGRRKVASEKAKGAIAARSWAGTYDFGDIPEELGKL